MARRCTIGWRFFIGACAMNAAALAHAAALAGRVVDSSGKAVAGAEVRVWQQVLSAERKLLNELVMLDGAECVRTDADGRFQTPDALPRDAFVRIVAEAEGTLAARSGWIEVGEEPAIAVADIVVRRLVELSGRVIDRQGRPVAAATVSNSGDGHRRVAAATDAAGRFRLQGVPERDVFLFAERPGYRFTGMLWQSAEDEPSLTLSSIAEHVEPLRTLAPLLSRPEEVALGRRLLDPYLMDVQESGTDARKRDAIGALAGIDPIAAFERADAMSIQEQSHRDLAQSYVAEACIRSDALSPDEVQSIIESTEGEVSVVHQYRMAVAHLGDDGRRRRLAWLDQASIHARRIREPAGRVSALAWVADGLFDADDSKAANLIVAELEPTALQLDASDRSMWACTQLILALAHQEPRRAAEWLERINDDFHYQETGGKLAIRLLPDHADLAEEIWERAIERSRQQPVGMHPWWRYDQVPDVCYLMAGVERQRALNLARRGANAALRIRGLAAVAEAIYKTDPAAARELLASIVREELPQMVAEDVNWYRFNAPPVIAAWLLPIAERVDAELTRECFWRALAMRSPRPVRDDLDDTMQTGEYDLIKKVARYDRRVAQFLLQPSVARLPEWARAAVSDNNSPAGRFGVNEAKWKIRYVADTAVHVSPAWSAEIAASLPKESGKSGFSPRNEAIVRIAKTLSLAVDNRWTTPNDAHSACFWNPPHKNDRWR